MSPFDILSFFDCGSLMLWDLGNIDLENPGKDDFELWSPSEDRAEQCLFGRQVRSSICSFCYLLIFLFYWLLVH